MSQSVKPPQPATSVDLSCAGGSPSGCSRSRRGRFSNSTGCVISPIPSGVAVALGLLTARWPAGTRGVAAQYAGQCKAMPLENAVEPERRLAYLLRCGSNSWQPSTRANRFGRCSVILGLTSNQVWGLTKTDPEWSAALEAALTAARRGDLEHGTNAAYVRGCVCKECREHQRLRMGRSPG